MKILRFHLFCLVLLFSSFLAFASDPITGEWKFNYGDDLIYKNISFNDSGWQTVTPQCQIETGENHWLWLRKTISLPADKRGKRLYFNPGQTEAAAEYYVNGILVYTRGAFPPYNHVAYNKSNVITIDEDLTKTGEISIACRIYCPQTFVTVRAPSFCSQQTAVSINFLKNVLNIQLYSIFAALSLFIGFYSLAQYLGNKKAYYYLMYALSTIFVSVYFYEMGTESEILPISILRPIARTCLPVSLLFLLMFLKTYTTGKVNKIMRATIYAIDVLIGIAYILTVNNSHMAVTVFNICLLPAVVTLIYGLILLVKALRRNEKEIVPILVGIAASFGLAGHDIIVQVSGKDTFVWLQGYAFFILDISIFVALAMRAARTQREFEKLIDQTASQHEKLSTIFENAKSLAGDTSKIAANLNESVIQLSAGSEKTIADSKGIAGAINQQKSTLNDAANVISSLVDSLISSQKELQNEAESISQSATRTFELIHSLDEVNKGINGAAIFAQQLNGISNAGVENMQKLSTSMQKVQESSQEILKITGVLDDFAERTNLLAMNASIEAAHAGEAGKGFSVVANEIKNLASASSQQSSKIAEIVTEVAQAIGEGVGLCKLVNSSLTKIKEESNVTAEQVKNSAEQMSEKQQEGYKIAEESKTVAGYANQMRQSAQNQTEYSEKVKDGMQALRQVSATVEEAADSIYKSNEALSLQVEQLKGLAASAEKTADQLTLMMK